MKQLFAAAAYRIIVVPVVPVVVGIIVVPLVLVAVGIAGGVAGVPVVLVAVAIIVVPLVLVAVGIAGGVAVVPRVLVDVGTIVVLPVLVDVGTIVVLPVLVDVGTILVALVLVAIGVAVGTVLVARATAPPCRAPGVSRAVIGPLAANALLAASATPSRPAAAAMLSLVDVFMSCPSFERPVRVVGMTLAAGYELIWRAR